MDTQTYTERIAELTEQIATLPKGYISKKTVDGHVYFYHQWSENGSKKSRYLKDEELVSMTEQIEQRKALQQELKAVKAAFAEETKKKSDSIYTVCSLMHKRTPVA